MRKPYTRRTPEQQIADLEAQIAGIKARAARRKATKDPAMKQVATAVRAIDKALSSTRDTALREALTEARATLDACLKLNGVAGKVRGPVGQVDPDDVLRLLGSRPGSKAEEVAEGLGVETKVVSRVLKGLREEGRVRATGKARGTRWWVGR